MSDNENPQPAAVDPDSIPEQDRIATLTIVWTKTNNILVKFPKDVHLAVKMVAVALNIVSDLVMQQRQPQQPEAPRIVPARTIPKMHPNFLKKQ